MDIKLQNMNVLCSYFSAYDNVQKIKSMNTANYPILKVVGIPGQFNQELLIEVSAAQQSLPINPVTMKPKIINTEPSETGFNGGRYSIPV